MKKIINKFGKIFSSDEAQEFKEELAETVQKAADGAQEIVAEGVSKTKEAAEIVKAKASAAKGSVQTEGKIGYGDFEKVEIKVGTIQSVEVVENADKLLLLQVDLGEEEPRQIVSGIRTYFDDVQSLVGRQAMFVTNLEPRTIKGHESNGMIFGVKDGETFSILEPDTKLTPGTKAS